MVVGRRQGYVILKDMLFSCSHTDQVDACPAHFRSMQAEHGAAPGSDHLCVHGRPPRHDEDTGLLSRSTRRLDATVRGAH